MGAFFSYLKNNKILLNDLDLEEVEKSISDIQDFYSPLLTQKSLSTNSITSIKNELKTKREEYIKESNSNFIINKKYLMDVFTKLSQEHDSEYNLIIQNAKKEYEDSIHLIKKEYDDTLKKATEEHNNKIKPLRQELNECLSSIESRKEQEQKMVNKLCRCQFKKSPTGECARGIRFHGLLKEEKPSGVDP